MNIISLIQQINPHSRALSSASYSHAQKHTLFVSLVTVKDNDDCVGQTAICYTFSMSSQAFVLLISGFLSLLLFNFVLLSTCQIPFLLLLFSFFYFFIFILKKIFFLVPLQYFLILFVSFDFVKCGNFSSSRHYWRLQTSIIALCRVKRRLDASLLMKDGT